MKLAIYPGTFDPITFGHLDLIQRASRCVDSLLVGVAESTPKKTLFTLEERMEHVRACTRHVEHVRVEVLNGLLVNYALEKEANFIIRGLRAFSDFEFEFQMALMNRKLAPDIETLFLMPAEEFSYVSSSRVKEVAQLGGDVTAFVPVRIRDALKTRFA